MKFAIEIEGEGGKLEARMAGFPELADACAAAIALATLRRRVGSKLFVSIRFKDGLLCGICCDRAEVAVLNDLVTRGTRQLQRVKQNKKQSSERHRFLQAHGGYDGLLYGYLFTEGLWDEAARKSFFANDFPAVLKRMTELNPQPKAAA